MRTLRVLSLFSGIGGLDLAAEWAGMQVVGQVEIDPYCQRVLARHWPHVKRVGDVREVWGDTFNSAVDVIMGGYPCQPFSMAGKRRGAADGRHLWPEMRRIIQVYQPTWIVAENVPGHVSMGLDDVLTDLAADGYEATAVVFPAAATGAPHLRERLFIMAHAQRERGPSGEVHAGDFPATLERGETGASRATCARCTNVAVTAGGGVRRLRESPNIAQSGEVVSNADSPRLSQRRERPARQPLAQFARVLDGQAQSGVGRAIDGIPGWLDGLRWPAGPGEAQHEWEAPRTTQERIPNRAARLKALGNAVVPQQAYPIFAAIAAVESGMA